MHSLGYISPTATSYAKLTRSARMRRIRISNQIGKCAGEIAVWPRPISSETIHAMVTNQVMSGDSYPKCQQHIWGLDVSLQNVGGSSSVHSACRREAPASRSCSVKLIGATLAARLTARASRLVEHMSARTVRVSQISPHGSPLQTGRYMQVSYSVQAIAPWKVLCRKFRCRRLLRFWRFHCFWTVFSFVLFSW